MITRTIRQPYTRTLVVQCPARVPQPSVSRATCSAGRTAQLRRPVTQAVVYVLPRVTRLEPVSTPMEVVSMPCSGMSPAFQFFSSLAVPSQATLLPEHLIRRTGVRRKRGGLDPAATHSNSSTARTRSLTRRFVGIGQARCGMVRVYLVKNRAVHSGLDSQLARHLCEPAGHRSLRLIGKSNM